MVFASFSYVFYCDALLQLLYFRESINTFIIIQILYWFKINIYRLRCPNVQIYIYTYTYIYILKQWSMEYYIV